MRMVIPIFVLALGLPACSNVDTPDMPEFMQAKDASSARQLNLPGSYLGSGDRAPRSASERAAAAQGPSETELRAAFEARNRQAAALWKRAEAAKGSERKADIYEDIADDFPEYPQAAEARYREGLHRYKTREWMDAIRALQSYVAIAPVNPHLPDVEEMIYRAALARLAERGGLFSIFQNDDDGLEALRYVATTFPAGEYPDDALLTLGRHYQKDPEELQRSMLYFKELLLRYPDSEWSFEARRSLGDTYALRDQGSAYHAGFVDRDPRENVPDDERAEAHAGPVHSSLGMALDEYDKYLERIERDPARQAEYATQVAAVTNRRRCLREDLARKDDRIAAHYAQRGAHKAAAVYRRSAAQWRGQKVASLRQVTGCEMPREPAAQPQAAPSSSAALRDGTPPPLPRQPAGISTQPGMPTRPPMPPPPAQRFPTAGSPAGSTPAMPTPAVRTPRTPLPRQPSAAPRSSRADAPPPPPPPSWPSGR